MSLYKEASLVMLPSAVKDGKLYSIRPTPEYGDEEITNGDFATDSNWTKEAGWTISGGKASYNGSAATSALYQNISAVSGTTYRVKFSVVNYVSGTFKAHLSNGNATGASPLITANGDYIFDITATGGLLLFRNVTSFNGSIDNVSVQEITKSGDFTFSRGSNLAATRVDVNGLIEKGRENLLLQSNQFDTTWYNSTITATSGQSGYDGSSNAWKLEKDAGSYRRIRQDVTSSGVWTFSVYAKKGTLDQIDLRNHTNAARASFDLSDGTLILNIGCIATNIDNVGNGWYRVSATFNGATTRVQIYVDWNQSTAGNIYIQDAQLEKGLVATDYIETGSSTAQAGILEDLPRLDYSGGASCPALLLEPQRTNSFLQSEYIKSGVGGWEINGDGTITAENNSTTSPEGKQNAAKITKDGSAYSYVRTSLASNGGVFSVYAKKGNYRYIGIRNADNTSNHSVFDFDTESFVRVETGHTCNFEDVGNGWYRLWDYHASGENAIRGVALCDANGTEYNPTTPNGSYNYVWGFQAEYDVSYPTSYIPTYGSSVTRSSDYNILDNASSLVGQTQGTLFAEYDFDATKSNNGGSDNDILSLVDNTSSDFIKITHYGSGSNGYNNKVYLYQRYNLQYEVNISSPVQSTGTIKVAAVYSENYYALFVNGVKIGEDTNASVPTCNRVHIAKQNNGLIQVVNPRKQIALFPTALTDSECIALTE